MEFDIVKVVAEALKEISNTGITVQEGWYSKDIKKTHITFFVYSEIPEDFSEDECISYTHSIQVDIWTTNGVEGNALKNKVRRLLSANNFKFTDSRDLFEAEEKLFHKAMRFNYLEDLEN